jgi:hypothetical protein
MSDPTDLKKAFLPKTKNNITSDRKSMSSLDKSDLKIILTTDALENAIESDQFYSLLLLFFI